MSSSSATLDLGPPSADSAVIVHIPLPGGLARLRNRLDWAAKDGVPAHATVLYPFVAPALLRRPVRERLAAVAADVAPFDVTLVGRARWPTVTWVRLEPATPFVAIVDRLQAAFPGFPLYGPDFDLPFVPHLTIVDDDAIDHDAVGGNRAWAALPLQCRIGHLTVIARPGPGGRWRTVWRVPLGRMRA